MSTEAKSIIQIVKSRGYWEVDIRPVESKEDRFESIDDCFRKVASSTVELRGWPYPVYFTGKSPYPMQGRIEAASDYGPYKEFWTMFLSGHFYHLFAVREDWLSEGQGTSFQGLIDIKPGTALDFIMTLHSITEIFEFAMRLAQKRVFGKQCKIKIILNRMEGRRITSFYPGRLILRNYICKEKNPTFNITTNVEDLIGQGHVMALNVTIKIFELFSWNTVSKEMLKEEQKRFLEKRI
jgi:hypothetical protein